MFWATEDYIRRLPKAELHLHLEGSVQPALLKKLMIDGDEEEAEELFAFKDFDSFLKSFRAVCLQLRDPESYLQVLDELKEYFLQQNIRYAEIFYTPSIPWKWERDGEAILKALLKRGRQIEQEYAIQIQWILDSVRQFGPELALRTVELAARFRDQGVVAVGLGGDENALPTEDYQEVFSWARGHQLFVHSHAGEIGEPEKVWQAIQLLGANRIGHGIQAARDSKLMEYLREHSTGLDICLTSNSRTGAWRTLSDNPFWLLYKRGVPVTLNTDDPGLFRTTLVEEYRKAVEAFELGCEDLHRLILQGVHNAFLPHAEKMALMQRFQEEIASLSP